MMNDLFYDDIYLNAPFRTCYFLDLNHALAQSDDMGETWGPARLLPIVGSTCEGSIGRDASSPPGQVMLGATYGVNRYRLGRANMTLFSMDLAATGAQPVPQINVWPNAAGYSDFAQVRSELHALVRRRNSC